MDLGGFYDQSEIKTIYIGENQIFGIFYTIITDKINIPTTLIYDGETFENVGVRFKGQTHMQIQMVLKMVVVLEEVLGNNVDTDKSHLILILIGKQIKILTVMKH